MSKKQIKVLMIDDEEFFCDLYKKFFEEKDLEVETVTSGKVAIEKLKENKETYDIILLDIIMPEVDGFETLEIIRDNELAKNSTFIIFSNRTDEEAKEKAKELGCTKFIIKSSTSPEQLVEEIKNIYQENKQ